MEIIENGFPSPNGRLTVYLPVLRAMMRKPSCLISCSQSLPEGNLMSKMQRRKEK